MNRWCRFALLGWSVAWGPLASAAPPVVEVEEDIFSFAPANNGAGPLWDYGSTNLVRIGATVFVSGLDTLPDVPPLNNVQCRLWRRDVTGWQSYSLPLSGQTREPCPLAVFPERRELFLSANPTLNPAGKPGPGPAAPRILQFSADDPAMVPTLLTPSWREGASALFTEHSYRSLAADSRRGDLILFQNIGYDRAEWALRDEGGSWSHSGHLAWPRDADVEPVRPLRLCYPSVLLTNHAVHFAGVSDIVEPNESWRSYKRELTGRSWDYVFRRLFYAWSPDIGGHEFSGWVELANRDKTAGRIILGDMWRAADERVHVIWEETAIDVRLRGKFFQNEKQRWELNHAVIAEGKVVEKHTLVGIDEGETTPLHYLPRFHATPSGRLFVFFYVSGVDRAGKRISENRLMEINGDGSAGPVYRVPLGFPLSFYMTASVRAGSLPSEFLDLIGVEPARPNVIRYARIRVE